MSKIHGKTIAVVNFGGQYAALIAGSVRKLGVMSRIFHHESFDPAREIGIGGIIFSGGPDSVNGTCHKNILFDINKAGVPVLGICYGHQLLAKLSGGNVSAGERSEYGLTKIKLAAGNGSGLFSGTPADQEVWMSHHDHVTKLPEGWRITSSTDSIAIASYESFDRKFFGVQFHPEVTHTQYGSAILDNFITICGIERNWRMDTTGEAIIRDIKEKAAGKKLLILVSGGVDSLVALKLCVNAAGPGSVFPLHVDTGFMRMNESAEVMSCLKKMGVKNARLADASNRFFAELGGVTDPEEKRMIIGRLFVETAEKELKNMNIDDNFILVQGTIYPDTIESGSKEGAAKIKTHHNRVAVIERMIERGLVLEPLKDLFKDEVRELGRTLGLDEKLLSRHPFPGPGLAIRMISSKGPAGLKTDLASDGPEAAAARKFGYNCAVLPIKSVGVQGDSRTYRAPAVIWRNGYAPPDWENIAKCASAIINGSETVNRVVYSLDDIDALPVLKKCIIDRKTVEKLKIADQVITEELLGIKEIWQVPIVGLPLFASNGGQCFVIRPVCSENAMTADFYQMDAAVLSGVNKAFKKIEGAGQLFYDVTSKPPATIEWE